MVMKLIRLLATSVTARWVTGALVTLLLGGGGLMWHSHKEGLRGEGKQECVQLINQATIDELQDALADERSAAADLRAKLAAAADVNSQAVARRNELESKVDALSRQIQEQREEDETYREWANSGLPYGVADRVRAAARATSKPGS